MIISAVHIPERLTPGISMQVVDMQGKDAFVAEYPRILELVEAGHVCGRMRGSRLRWIELIVPVEDAKPKALLQAEARQAQLPETPGSVNARTNLGAYRQKLTEGICWSLHFCKTLDGASA